MKKITISFIGIIAVISLMVYGFNFQFEERSTGFSKVSLNTFSMTPPSPKGMQTESFDGTTFPPTGWKDTAIAGPTYLWTRSTAGTLPTCSPHSGLGMAYYNSYNASSGYNCLLITPAFSLTGGQGTVSFWMYRDPGYSTSYDSVGVWVNTQSNMTGAVPLGNVWRYSATANWYQFTYTIPASFNGPTNYLIFRAWSAVGNNMYIDDISYGFTYTGPMAYSGSTTTKINPGAVLTPGTTNNQIVQVAVSDSGVSSPFTINRLRFQTVGNNPATDIANAKLFYTRSNSSFSTTRQYGSTISSPSGVMNFSDTATLDPNSTNYFWLTYDISSGATLLDSVNAQCDSIIGTSPMGGVVPTVTYPSGLSNVIDRYCMGTYTYAGLPYGIYITNVNFGSINVTSGCPNPTPYVWNNYTSASTVVRQNNPYPITVTNQNIGNPNATSFGIYIDWNNNYSFADPGEYTPTTVIPGNTTISATATINVPNNATIGTHRMRIRANLSSPPGSGAYCSALTYGEQEDYSIIVVADSNMVVSSTNATQTVLSSVTVPSVNQQILGIQVSCSGSTSPLSTNSFSFGTNGSTNPTTDISNAKLYYTGTNNAFYTTQQVGATVNSPNGPFTIPASVQLSSGVNYFWLTYDVPSGAVTGDSLDAQLNSVTVGGNTFIPTVIAPLGKRGISGSTLCGTYTIPGSYPTIAAAITAINTQGVITCPIVFNVAAGYTEVASNLTITSTGSAGNTVTFQKSGTGSNPAIVAGTGTGSFDGIIKFYGATYLIFDGIDLRDTSANTTTATQMEWGYALLRPDGTHGNQNITIKNCNISLIKTNTATYGIYSSNLNLTGVAQTISATSGTNSYNQFLSNNISSCYGGIYLNSPSDGTFPFSLEDQSNVISTTGSGRNTITNFGGSSTTAYGIYANYQCNPTITNTYINSRGGINSTGGLYGIYNYAYYNSGNCTVMNDTVTLVDTTGSLGTQYGIYNYTYYGINNTVSNNVVTGCVNPTTSTYYNYYIYNYTAAGSQAYMQNNYVMNNKVYGNTFGVAGSSTSYTYDIYNYGMASNKSYFYNNLDSGNTVLGTTSYTAYQMYNYILADTAISNKNRIVNNTLCGTTATATMYGFYNYYYQSYLYSQTDSNFVGNNTSPSTSSTSYYCLYNGAVAANMDFSNNTVSGNSMSGSGTLYSLYHSPYTTPPIGSVENITNNLVNSQSKLTATGTGTIYGLYHGGSAAGTINMNNNTITNITSAAATTVFGLYQIGSPPNYVNFINNKIGNFNVAGAGTIYGLNNNPSSTTIANFSQDSIFNLVSAGGTVYGLYSVNGNPVSIYKNRINGISTTTSTTALAYGMYISGGTVTNVYNNIVTDVNATASTSIAPAVAGIYIAGCTYNYLYDNTVYLKATSTSATTFGTAALYVSTTYNVDLRNNIFVDNSTPGATGGFAVAYRRSSTTLTTYLNGNNNCFYAGTPATNRLIYYDGTNSDQTLAAFKTRMVSRDNNSISEMPPFVNSTTAPYDLHISTGTATGLESGGQVISTPTNSVNITDDAFGTARYPNSGYPVGGFTPTNPDIGAHEFGGLRNNVTGPVITYTPLGIGGTTNRSFNNVNITAPAGVNTTSGTKPRVYYKRSTDTTIINDNTNLTNGWKYVEANGTTSPFDFTIDYSLLYGGTGVAAGNIIQYFVIAQDLNGTPNVASNQATFTTAPTSVALTTTNCPISNYLSYTIGTATFSGVIPVGTGQTYTSLTSAGGIFAALNAGTVSGDITISITSDLTEDGTNALNALNETGAGRYKVRIVSADATLKTISGWVSTQAMIRLNGVRRVTIDGDNGLGSKYLRFRNKSVGTANPVIQFMFETGVDTLKNCTIEGANYGTGSGLIYFAATTVPTGIGNDSICVNSNDIRDRSDTTAVFANAIYSLGASNTLLTYNNYNSVINNNIYNYFYDAGSTIAGVYLSTYNTNWVISGNSFYQTVSRSIPVNATSVCDIYSSSSLNNAIKVLNNYFGGTAPTCGGTALTYTGAGAYSLYPVYLTVGLLSPSSIQGNTFGNVNLTTSPAASSSAFYRPIYVSSGYVNIGNLSGNTIGSGTGTGNISLTTNTSTSSYTIAMIYHLGIGSVMNNTIGSITFAGNSTGTGDLYAGLYWSNSTAGQIYTVSNNLIGSLSTANSIQCTNNTNYHALRGMYYLNSTGTTNYITNNIVSNITSFNTISGTLGLVSVYGIQHNTTGFAPITITGNTVRYLTVNQNIPSASYALLGIGCSAYDFNTVTNNNIYGLYSNGTGGGTPLMGAMLLGGYTGGYCANNKIFDFKYSGIGVSNPYPLILGLNCQSYGVWNIVNNQVSFTNGEPSDKLVDPSKLTFKQVPVENPPINLKAITQNEEILKAPVLEGQRNPGLYDESKGEVQKPNFGKNGDYPNSTSEITIAANYHTNNTWKGTVNYINNSFYVGGSVPGTSSFNSYAFVRTGNGLLNMKNNIFVNARTGGGGYHLALANEGSLIEGWPANSSNSNLLVAAYNRIGEWGVGNFQTYDQWVYSANCDANSYWETSSNLPGTILYRNAAGGDLNVDTTKFGAAYVYQKVNGLGLTNDYNGNPRSVSGLVCIGSHEFILTKPVVPTLISPANGSTGNQTPVQLVWNKPLFAASYLVQIATDSLFNSIVATGTPTDSTYSFTGASPLTYYYWRVYPVYSTGAVGKYMVSSTFKFKAIGTPNTVVLNSPSNGATNQAISLNFNWFKAGDQTFNLSGKNRNNGTNTTTNTKGNNGSTSNGPNSVGNYWFELSTDSTFATVFLRDSTLTDSTRAVSGLTNAATYYWRVKAKNQFGWGNFSTMWSFTTIVPAPTVPVLLTPANGAINVNPSPTITWQAVPYAASYRIQVSTDSTFATTFKDTSGVTVAQLSLVLAYNTKYYWRVNATNIVSTSAWSAVWNFRTSSDPTALSMSNFAPVICPKYMASGTATRLPVAVRGTISGLVPGKTYRYYNLFAVSTDLGTTGLGAGIIMILNPSGVFNYASTGSLTTAGSYGTFVANASGNYTGWFGGLNSGNTRFTAGNYVYPSVVIGDSVGTVLARYAMSDSINVLAFSTTSGLPNGTGVYGISYGLPRNMVAVYDNTAGTGKPLASTWLESDTITLPSAVPFYTSNVDNQNGRWGAILPNALATGVQRVEQRGLTNGSLISFNTNPTGIWPSGVNTINPLTGTTPLVLAINDAPLFNAPVQVSPANGSLDLSATPTITWNSVNTALSYRLQVSTDSTYTTTNFDTAGYTGTSITVPSGKLTTNTKYYWRVNATNAVGTSVYSGNWNFTTAPLVPNAPVLVSPSNGSTNQPISLTCVWRKSVETLALNKISNISKGKGDSPLTMANYWFEYTTDSTFATGVIRDTTLTDTTKALSGLSYVTKYFWRVKGKNQTGWGSFSSAWSFTTAPPVPAAPTLLSPANGSTGLSLTPTLSWNSVTYAVSYRLQVSTDSTFATTQWDTTGVTGTSNVVPAGKLANLTKYYWRVNATNGSGTGSYSAVWNFTTIVAAPVAPTLLTPANGSTGVSLTPSCTWSSVPNAVTYRFQVSTDSTFATTQWDTAGVGTTSVTVPAGKLSQTTKYYWRVNATNAGGTGPWASKFNFTTLSLSLTLNLKVYLEGFWDGSTHVSDTVYVYLAGATTPHAYVDTAKVVLSTTGTASMNFYRATAGSYFIVVQHRNHLQTWSAAAQTFTGGTPLSYDFTTAATQAFGSNMKQVGTAWVLYGGDANIDGSIDAVDISIFIGQFGTQGYLSCDFNGDGDVNASDVQIIAANFGLTVAIPSVPPPGPDNTWRKKVNVNDIQNAIKNAGKEKGNKNNKNNK